MEPNGELMPLGSWRDAQPGSQSPRVHRRGGVTRPIQAVAIALGFKGTSIKRKGICGDLETLELSDSRSGVLIGCSNWEPQLQGSPVMEKDLPGYLGQGVTGPDHHSPITVAPDPQTLPGAHVFRPQFH